MIQRERVQDSVVTRHNRLQQVQLSDRVQTSDTYLADVHVDSAVTDINQIIEVTHLRSKRKHKHTICERRASRKHLRQNLRQHLNEDLRRELAPSKLKKRCHPPAVQTEKRWCISLCNHRVLGCQRIHRRCRQLKHAEDHALVHVQLLRHVTKADRCGEVDQVVVCHRRRLVTAAALHALHTGAIGF